MANKKTHEEFIKEVTIMYPDIQVLSEYVGAHTNVTLGCVEGHTWLASPTNLLSKGTRSKCRECKGKNNIRIDWTSENINKLRELVTLGLDTEELTIEFNTTKVSIDNACSRNNITRDKFHMGGEQLLISKCKELGYTITKIGCGLKTLFSYVCNNGHEHTQIVGNFLRGHHCPKCYSAAGISKVETELLEFINSIYSGWVEVKDRSILEGKELDIVLPDLGIAIEFNGNYWHQEEKVGKYYHQYKTDTVNNFGFQLIHIGEDLWNNKKDIIKSRIKSMLSLSTKVYARNCIVRPITFPKDFLNTNHLQGAGSPSSYNYGLFLKGELVAVMTFSTPRFSKDYDFELVRYCSLLDTTIVGGASKLLKAFRKEQTGSIISYSDKSWSKGALYKKLGFSYSHTSAPNYRYYKHLQSLSRYECQKHLLKTKFPESYKDELTEKEIMTLEGYYPVYDSGNDVWVLMP